MTNGAPGVFGAYDKHNSVTAEEIMMKMVGVVDDVHPDDGGGLGDCVPYATLYLTASSAIFTCIESLSASL